MAEKLEWTPVALTALTDKALARRIATAIKALDAAKAEMRAAGEELSRQARVKGSVPADKKLVLAGSIRDGKPQAVVALANLPKAKAPAKGKTDGFAV